MHVLAVKAMVEEGFEQAAAFGLGGGELLFQPVAEGHQFVHLGDDAVLLGFGRLRFSTTPALSAPPLLI